MGPRLRRGLSRHCRQVRHWRLEGVQAHEWHFAFVTLAGLGAHRLHFFLTVDNPEQKNPPGLAKSLNEGSLNRHRYVDAYQVIRSWLCEQV